MTSKRNPSDLPYTAANFYAVEKFRNLSYASYRSQLRELRVQLLLLQEWVERNNRRLAIVLEGRDAAGKGTTAATITRYLNPQKARVIAQGVPSRREMRNWLGSHYRMLPVCGEIAIFDRSWYSRALVQPAMGYCSMKQYHYFMNHVNAWEEKIVDGGVDLVKIYLSISKESQDLRFKLRQHSELKYWKYSANDRHVAERWHLFTYFKERMFAVTSTDYAPWVAIDSDNKHQARLNAIHCLLSRFSYDRRDLALSSANSDSEEERFTRVVIDGVLFSGMTADQIEILERIHMHE